MPGSKIVSGFKLNKKLDRKVVKKAKEQIRTYAIRHFERHLQPIVDVFQNGIQIQTITKTVGDVFTVTVQAREGILTTSRVSNTPIETARIFEFLNEGTQERKISVPKDYQRASSPNSLTTRLVENDRNKNYFSLDTKKGIEARNWTTLLALERQPYTEKLLERIFKTLSSQFISRL